MSYLFVPAASPARIPKAFASGADRVIVDLEDGVAESEKDQARRGLFDLEVDRPATLRINARMSDHFGTDLEAASTLTWVDAVMVPKVERIEDVIACPKSNRNSLQLNQHGSV